jgi:hypothetical protein
MEIYNLLFCGIKYDIDDFEFFLLKIILRPVLKISFTRFLPYCISTCHITGGAQCGAPLGLSGKSLTKKNDPVGFLN